MTILIRNACLALPLLACLVVSGCRPRTVGDRLREAQGNEFVRTIESEEYRIAIAYVPEDVYLLRVHAVDTATRYNQRLMDSLKALRSTPGLTFTVSLSPRNDSLPLSDLRNDVIYGQQYREEKGYREAMQEYLFGLTEKIWVEANGLRRNMRTYQMGNSWGFSKSRSFVLLFDPLPFGYRGDLVLAVEGLVPGQGRHKVAWKIP